MKKLYASLACMALLAGSVHAQTFTKLAGTNVENNKPGPQLPHPGITEIITPTYKEFQLTTNTPVEQKAAVWNNAMFSLTGNWSFKAQLNFGPWDETKPDESKPLAYRSGADGIAFVMSDAKYLGQWGEEMGYGTRDVLTPGAPYIPNNSLAFEMDTWENTTSGFAFSQGYLNHNEPGDGNHVAFMSKGNTIHNGAAFPAIGGRRTLSFDLETADWIDVTVSWTDNPNPGQGGTLSIVSPSDPNLNSSITLTDAELISIFGSANPSIYLGFSAATGAAANNHRIRWMLDAPPPSCGQLRTQTQGGWGTSCNGGNPGCYRDAKFGSAFPSGVRIGSTEPGGRSLLFTNSLAVKNFLPSGGPSKTLAQLGLPVGQTTNPSGANAASGRSNINGQLLALSLSVGFDDADPNFGPAGVKLGDMVIGSGAYSGWTVRAFLTYANNYVGGSGTDAAIISNIQSTAGSINENYVDGTRDNGYLNCPAGTQSTDVARMGRPAPTEIGSEKEKQVVAEPEVLGVSVYPNPSRGQINVNTAQLPAGSEIQIISARGNLVARRMAGGAQSVSFELKQYGTGVYLIKVINGGKVQATKVLVQD